MTGPVVRVNQGNREGILPRSKSKDLLHTLLSASPPPFISIHFYSKHMSFSHLWMSANGELIYVIPKCVSLLTFVMLVPHACKTCPRWVSCIYVNFGWLFFMCAGDHRSCTKNKISDNIISVRLKTIAWTHGLSHALKSSVGEFVQAKNIADLTERSVLWSQNLLSFCICFLYFYKLRYLGQQIRSLNWTFNGL